MTKKEILDHFYSATKAEQRALTMKALKHLSDKGINVSRQALKLWRDTTTDTSPLRNFYHRAYQHAIQNAALKPAAQQ